MKRGFAGIDEKFVGVDERFAGVDGKFGGMHARFAAIDLQFARIDEKFALTDGKIAAMGASLQNVLHREMRELFRWMLAFWATTMISVIGLIVAIFKYGGR